MKSEQIGILASHSILQAHAINHYKMKRLILLLPILFIAAACDSSQVAQLQKENVGLKAQIDQQHTADQFDLAARCADRAAQYWKAQGFDKGSGQPNELDSYTDHYGIKLNKCFILINQSWTTDASARTQLNPIELDDVLEGKNYADILIKRTGDGWLNETVSVCWLRKDGDQDQKRPCATKSEFDDFVSQYMIH